jgi:hypothetical protein
MNIDDLVRNFNRLLDSSSAVAQLSNFALDLAAHGRLVEQDADDGSASDLMAQLTAARQIVGRKKIRVPSQPGLDSTASGPFDLPDKLGMGAAR